MNSRGEGHIRLTSTVKLLSCRNRKSELPNDGWIISNCFQTFSVRKRQNKFCKISKNCSLSALLNFHSLNRKVKIVLYIGERHNNQIFFPILYIISSFLLISFSFSWNVHWVLSLSPVQCMYFIVWRWRVDSGKKSEKILP